MRCHFIFKQKNIGNGFSHHWLVPITLFILPGIGTKLLTILMFIPAVTALIFKRGQHNRVNVFKQKMNLKGVLFGCLYPICFIFLCSFLSEITGIVSLDMNHLPDSKMIIALLVTILINLFTVLGEEYGWRGYLLPLLTKQFGKTKVTVMLGIIWAMYHVPVVFFFSKSEGVESSYFTLPHTSGRSIYH